MHAAAAIPGWEFQILYKMQSVIAMLSSAELRVIAGVCAWQLRLWPVAMKHAIEASLTVSTYSALPDTVEVSWLYMHACDGVIKAVT